MFAEGTRAMAETPEEIQKKIDEAKKQTELILAEKAKIDAEKALADAKKAAEGPDADAKALKDLQTQKGLADAQKALADAQTAALLAKTIGDVKAGPYSGAVEMKDKAGTAEAALLAAKAVKECATKIVAAVEPNVSSEVYVFASADFPKFQKLLTYQFRKELIKKSFDDLDRATPGEAPAPALVAAGLDALSKVLGFFKTDSTVGGIESKVDEAVLVFSVAGGFKSKKAHVPALYNPSALTDPVKIFTDDMKALSDLRAKQAAEIEKLTPGVEKLEKQIAAETNEQTKKTLQNTLASLKSQIARRNAPIALYDAFVSSLTTPDANGAVPLTAIAQELAIHTALNAGAAVLLLRLETTGGGYLVKKNLLTGLGAMPLFHMGGASASYLLLDGKDGTVLGGDVVPVYGGYVRTDKLRDFLK